MLKFLHNWDVILRQYSGSYTQVSHTAHKHTDSQNEILSVIFLFFCLVFCVFLMFTQFHKSFSRTHHTVLDAYASFLYFFLLGETVDLNYWDMSLCMPAHPHGIYPWPTSSWHQSKKQHIFFPAFYSGSFLSFFLNSSCFFTCLHLHVLCWTKTSADSILCVYRA